MTRDIGLNPEQSKVKKLVVGARQYAEKDRLQEAEKRRVGANAGQSGSAGEQVAQVRPS